MIASISRIRKESSMVTLAPSPRNAQLSERGRIFRNGTLFFLVPSLFTVLWLTIDVSRHLLRREAFRHDGQEVVAKIEKFGRFGRSSELWVKYVFAAQGKSFSAEFTVPPSFEDSLDQARDLRVRYCPSNPEDNYPADWEWSVGSQVEWLVPCSVGSSWISPCRYSAPTAQTCSGRRSNHRDSYALFARQ